MLKKEVYEKDVSLEELNKENDFVKEQAAIKTKVKKCL